MSETLPDFLRRVVADVRGCVVLALNLAVDVKDGEETALVNESRTTDSVMGARMVPDEVVLSQDLLWLAGFPSGCNRSAREPVALFAGLALVVAGNCNYLWMGSSSV